jgi:hypothetical protein
MFKGHIRELDGDTAKALVGKTIGIAITYISHTGPREERRWHGTITSAEAPNGYHAGFVQVAIKGETERWGFAGHQTIRPATVEESAAWKQKAGVQVDYMIAYEIQLPPPSPRSTPDSERNLSGMMRDYLAAPPKERQTLGKVIAAYDKEVYAHFREVEEVSPPNYSERRCLDDLCLIAAVGIHEDPRDVTHLLDVVLTACTALPHEAVQRCYDEAAALAESDGRTWLAERIRGYPSLVWKSSQRPKEETNHRSGHELNGGPASPNVNVESTERRSSVS